MWLRNWPLWVLGRPGLTALANFQAAERLGHLVRTETVAIQAGYRSLPRLAADEVDLFAYRRLRAADLLPPVFRPADGRQFVRVVLTNAAVVALAVVAGPPPGVTGTLVEHIRDLMRDQIVGADLTAGRVVLLAALIGCGLDDPAVSALMWHFGRVAATVGQVAGCRDRLVAAWPGLADHLRDRVPDAFARCLGGGVTSALAREQTGYFPQREREAAGRGGFLHHLATTQLVTEVHELGPARRAVAGRLQSRGYSPVRGLDEVRDAHLQGLTRALAEFRPERWVSPSGRVFDRLPWVEARGVFLRLADEALREIAFGVIDRGYRVVAVGPGEFVVDMAADADLGRLEGDLRAVARDVEARWLRDNPVGLEWEPVDGW